MKKILRALSMILSVNLVIGCCGGILASAAGMATTSNAAVTLSNEMFDFSNGDFECGEMYGWSMYPQSGGTEALQDMIDTENTKVVAEAKHSGKYGLRIVRKDSSAGYLELRAELRHPRPGIVYEFSYYGKTTEDAKVCSDIYLRYLNGSDPVEVYHTAHTEEADYIQAGGDWEKRTYNFQVPESYGLFGSLSQYDTLYIDFRLLEYGKGTIYIDDVSVKESNELTYGGSKIDSNFSSGGWNANGKSGAVASASEKKAAHEVYYKDFTDGLGCFTGNENAFSISEDPFNYVNKVLRYTGKDAWDSEGTYSGSLFTPGEEYTMTFRYYAKSMSKANGPVTVQCGFSGNPVDILTITNEKDNVGWNDVSYTFTAGTIDDSTRLFQVVNGGENKCEVFFDDIRITHMDTPYYETIVSYNNTFKDGLGYFSGNNRAFSLGTDPVDASNQVLRYTGKNAWDYEGAYSGSLFTPGEEYTMTFRYYALKMVEAKTPVTVQCGFSGELVNILTIRERKDNVGWIDVSYTFTAGTIINTTRLFQVVNGGEGTCEVFFDDIKVTHKKFYDEPLYGAGKYQDKNGTWVLHTNMGGEFFRNSLSMTPGHTYQISFDAKTEGSYLNTYLLDQTNGNKRMDFNAYNTLPDTDWRRVCIEYFCDGTGKNTNAEGNIVYRLGFFRNKDGGSVYIKNITLREIIYTEIKTATPLKDESLIPADSVLAEDAKLFVGNISGTLYEGGDISVTVSNATADRKYLLTYRALTTYSGSNFEISGSFGDVTWTVADFGREDGWLTMNVEITAQNSGDVILKLANENGTYYRDISLTRVYEYGDMNGDEAVDIKDLVAYKKYLAKVSGYQAKTLVYSDIDRNNEIDGKDLEELRKVLLGIN